MVFDRILDVYSFFANNQYNWNEEIIFLDKEREREKKNTIFKIKFYN